MSIPAPAARTRLVPLARPNPNPDPPPDEDEDEDEDALAQDQDDQDDDALDPAGDGSAVDESSGAPAPPVDPDAQARSSRHNVRRAYAKFLAAGIKHFLRHAKPKQQAEAGPRSAANILGDNIADIFGDAFPCPTCQAGKADDCACPGCLMDDSCWCAAMLPQTQGDNDPPLEYREHAARLTSSSGEGFALAWEIKHFAEPPEWINYLPVPGTYTHPTYGAIAITAARNRDFVANFNAGLYQRNEAGEPSIPIDAEHETKLSGAVGWIRQLRANMDGSVDAKVAWTDRGRALLAEKRFEFFSPEWYDDWQEPFSGVWYANIATGGALTTRPYFKNNAAHAALRPLVASERGLAVLEETLLLTHKEDPMDPTTTPTAVPAAAPVAVPAAAPAAAPVQLSESEILRFREQESELKALREANEKIAGENKAFADQLNHMAEANQRKAFAEEAAALHLEPETFATMMQGLSPEARTAVRTFYDPIVAQRNEADLWGKRGVRGAEPDGAQDGQAVLNARVRAKMAEDGKLSFAAASRLVLAEQPELMDQAKRASEIRA